MYRTLFTEGWTHGLKGEPKRAVILPHDAMQLQQRDPDEKSGSGCAYFPGGVYTYQKKWYAPEGLAGKRMILHFEGVYRNTVVKVNDQTVGEKHYGYAPFWIDISETVRTGEENVIEVEADNSRTPNSRWYSGGGIYRPVWLLTGTQNCIKPGGVKVKTLSIDPARIQVSADTFDTDAASIYGMEKRIEILSAGDCIAQAILHGEDHTAFFDIPNGRLWSEENPALYTCRVSVLVNGAIKDSEEVCFGIRLAEVSPKGLFMNGKETKLRGGCIHSDNGIIGAASFYEAEYRKVKLLKDAGFNALRIAHNPASPALLKACDELGVYVMDEGWDMWYKRKTKYDYGEFFMDEYWSDIEAMVDTDYNHPSVIMYSIGNEISEPAEDKGIQLACDIADRFRCLDDTRILTVGCNITILYSSKVGQETFDPESDSSNGVHDDEESDMDSTKFNEMISQFGEMMEGTANSKEADEASTPLFEAVDVAGYNYASGRYVLDGELHPDRVIVGSETFPQCIYRNWQLVKKLPYLIGDFMWTAMDYIGEVGIGAWSYTPDGSGFTKPYPWVLGEVGAMDLIGTPTGELFMAQAAWDLLKAPAIAVSPDLCYPGIVPAKGAWRGTNTIPSWSFAGCEGRETYVEVYSTSPFVALFINGKAIGVKTTENAMAVYRCTYEPGVLEAVSYDADGKEMGRSRLESAAGNVGIRLTQEQGNTAVADGSIVFVDVDLVGENGIVESHADQTIQVSVEGGTLLGFGSGKARTESRFVTGFYETHYGRALAAVMVGETGTAKITATGQGIRSEIILSEG
ncbi:MAG: DUF4982 domain-containing protein [Blautia sp.]|nr:DUF4982 domain-containing protein [Blautia sp.]